MIGRTLSRERGLPARRSARWEPGGLWIVLRYTTVIVVAELSSSFVGALPGAMVDAALVPVLLIHFVIRRDAPHRRIFPALALVALLRTLSIAAFVPRLPAYLSYAAVGLPVLVGAYLALRLMDEPVYRRPAAVEWPLEWEVGLAILGLPAGLLGYLLLRPAPILPDPTLPTVLAAMAVLAVFGGFLEEVVYRVVLQSAAIDAFSSEQAGIVFAATVGGVMYWGSGSIPYAIAILWLGIALGFALSRGATLRAIAASHTVLLWGMALLWPALLH